MCSLVHAERNRRIVLYLWRVLKIPPETFNVFDSPEKFEIISAKRTHRQFIGNMTTLTTDNSQLDEPKNLSISNSPAESDPLKLLERNLYLCDLWLRSTLLSLLLRPPLQSISLGLNINSLDLLWMRSSSRSRSLINCCWVEQSSILGPWTLGPWTTVPAASILLFCFCKGLSRDRLLRLTTDVAPEAA